MDVAINSIKTTITVPQVDSKLLKELARKWLGYSNRKEKWY